MNCPDCGQPVEKGAQFCPKCFARIEPPGLLQRVISFFQRLARPPVILKSEKAVKIAIVDKDGNRREYRSMDEVPLAMRPQLEKLEADALKDEAKLFSAEELAAAGGKPGLISKRSVSVYRIRDASGKERIFHSLDEMPPEIRAALEKFQGKSGPHP